MFNLKIQILIDKTSLLIFFKIVLTIFHLKNVHYHIDKIKYYVL